MNPSDRSIIDDISERLRNSPLSEYQTATYLGSLYGHSKYPVLLSAGTCESGIWVLGGARSGKTQRVIASLAKQSIARNDRPEFVLDLKGDDVLLHTLREEAAKWGRDFWIYTNVPRFSTRLFNPLAQKNLDNLNRSSITELFIASMNLFFGFGYGKQFFSSQSLRAFADSIIARETLNGWSPVKGVSRAMSFVQLEKRITEVVKKRTELRGAEGLTMVVRQLANVFAMNGGCCDLHPASAVTAGIQMDRFLRPDANGRFPVLYCYLRAESEPVTSSMTAKLFLNLLKNAVRQRLDEIQLGTLTEPPPLVSVYIDECQHVLDAALQNLLEQGASMGLRFVLANQDVSQLWSGDRDYFPTVWENCGVKVILSSRDNTFQELLMKLSGEKAMHNLSYMLDDKSVAKGRLGPNSALHGIYQVQEAPGPRFERNDLIELSAIPGRAIFIPAQNDSLASYNGYPVMVDVPYVHSPGTFARLKLTPWPAVTPETVVPQDYMERWEDYLEQQRQ